MDESHLPTPPWQLFETGNETVKTGFLFPAIIKVAREHSSVGLTKDAVVSSPETLRATVRSRLKEYSQPVYAESFVTGREFQVTMLSQRTGPLILPPAEIVYTKDTDVPFLTYESRWNEEHPDYDNSQVGLAKLDNDLLTRIETMSMDAYTAFGFRDYARFDIRCDGDTPYFLEVNSNPGLGDDNEYGMTVSYKSLGMTFADFVWEIVASAIRRYDSEGM
jgi:D-alanine-D-alanine ligase